MGYSLIGYALIAIATVASAVITANSQPEPPKMPSKQTEATPLDKSQLQDEADLAQLQLGEGDAKRKRKRGKEAFVVALEEKQQTEAAKTDPASVKIGGSGGQGLQLDGGVDTNTKTTPKRDQTGVQI